MCCRDLGKCFAAVHWHPLRKFPALYFHRKEDSNGLVGCVGASVPTLRYHSFLGYDQREDVPSSSSGHHEEVQQVAEGCWLLSVNLGSVSQGGHQRVVKEECYGVSAFGVTESGRRLGKGHFTQRLQSLGRKKGRLLGKELLFIFSNSHYVVEDLLICFMIKHEF